MAARAKPLVAVAGISLKVVSLESATVAFSRQPLASSAQVARVVFQPSPAAVVAAVAGMAAAEVAQMTTPAVPMAVAVEADLPTRTWITSAMSITLQVLAGETAG